MTRNGEFWLSKIQKSFDRERAGSKSNVYASRPSLHVIYKNVAWHIIIFFYLLSSNSTLNVDLLINNRAILLQLIILFSTILSIMSIIFLSIGSRFLCLHDRLYLLLLLCIVYFRCLPLRLICFHPVFIIFIILIAFRSCPNFIFYRFILILRLL